MVNERRRQRTELRVPQLQRLLIRNACGMSIWAVLIYDEVLSAEQIRGIHVFLRETYVGASFSGKP